MAKESRQKIVREWKDISLSDKVRSMIFKTPATFGCYSESYSKYVKEVLNCEDLRVTKVTRYSLDITCSKGVFSFKISNYPYSYGKLQNLPTSHHWFHEELDWEAILKVRELQLEQRNDFFRDYDEKHSSL